MEDVEITRAHNPKVAYGNINRDMQIRMNLNFTITMESSEQSQDYIKHTCSDIITKSLETVAALLRNRRGEFLKPVWAPWFDDSMAKALVYLKAGSIPKPASSLNWLDGRELLNNGYFNICTRKDGTEDKKQSVNIKLLYNGKPEDREEIRRYL
eukprot:6252407-Ditylum_brightwellii.AAC.1